MTRRGVATARHRFHISTVLALSVIALLQGAARADVLVLDVCMSKCEEEDWRAIGNLRRVLGTEMHSALVGLPENMLNMLRGHLPLPSITDPSLTVEKLTKDLKDGIDQWTRGDHEAAAESLRRTLGEVVSNPAVVAVDSTLRPLIVRAYIARAVSLLRLKRPNETKDARMAEAKEAIADLVRLTPETSILESAGSKPDEIFQKSRGDLIAQGTGTLTIQINDPTTVYYLHIAGTPYSGVFTREVFAGIYNVFVIDAMKRSRRYRVEVEPQKHTILSIDWRMDTKFEILIPRRLGDQSPHRRVGFTFSSFPERRLESKYASRIAQQVPGSIVVVVGRILWEGKQAMIGCVYLPNQPPYRVGVVLGLDLQAARNLSNYLLTDKPVRDVIELTAPPWAQLPAVRGEEGVSTSTKWLFVGGVIATVTGAGMYAADRDFDRGIGPYGIGIGLAGLAAVGCGFLFGPSDAAGPVVSVRTTHAMVGWAGRF